MENGNWVGEREEVDWRISMGENRGREAWERELGLVVKPGENLDSSGPFGHLEEYRAPYNVSYVL